jgi:L-asparaginase
MSTALKPSILIIYTGGTIGMITEPLTRSLVPVDFNEISAQLPELLRFDLNLSTYTFNPVVDSSNITPKFWIELAQVIGREYLNYDGFVILHGTDTMCYTASALSFMLENLNKPVVFTGSQLPIGVLRTDGKENLLTAIEIAAERKNNQPMVPEVCVFFQNKLYRGNRTSKHNAEYFNAFVSENYPPLAEAGISIHYNYGAIHYPVNQKQLKVHTLLNDQVAILKLFPGIRQDFVETFLALPWLKGLVLETFGAGNATTADWFIDLIRAACDRGVIILNVTQCPAGAVNPGKYETSRLLHNAGVINGRDLTTEAAITKLMFLLGQVLYPDIVKENLNVSISGEITI